MAITERTVHEYRCDNPACEKVVLHDPKITPKPDGFHGTVDLVVAGKSQVGGPWFAHTAKCISRAVGALTNGSTSVEDEDEEGPQIS